MDKKDISKHIRWFDNAYKNISLAGGNPSHVLDNMSEDLLYTLIANDIHLIYKKDVQQT